MSAELKAPETNTAEPLLRLSNIETFYGPIMAIRGVSLEVPKGSIVTVTRHPVAVAAPAAHASKRRTTSRR